MATNSTTGDFIGFRNNYAAVAFANSANQLVDFGLGVEAEIFLNPTPVMNDNIAGLILPPIDLFSLNRSFQFRYHCIFTVSYSISLTGVGASSVYTSYLTGVSNVPNNTIDRIAGSGPNVDTASATTVFLSGTHILQMAPGGTLRVIIENQNSLSATCPTGHCRVSFVFHQITL